MDYQVYTVPQYLGQSANPYPLGVKDSATDWAYRVCRVIEECGASPKLTEAVVLASELMGRLQAHERQFGIIAKPEYPKPSNFDSKKS